MVNIKFTDYQLSKKWTDLSVCKSDYHGWCVKEGKFGSIIFSGLFNQEECEKYIEKYKKEVSKNDEIIPREFNS